MKFKNIHVYSKAGFAKWLAGAKKEAADAKQAAQARTPARRSSTTSGCGGCHTFTPDKSSGYSRPEAR